MKYLITLLTLIFLLSCETNAQPKSLLKEVSTIVKVDTIKIRDTIILETQVTEIKKELYCPINLSEELTKSKTRVSNLEDSLYNMNVMQNTLLEYVPSHIQNAFKNKK